MAQPVISVNGRDKGRHRQWTEKEMDRIMSKFCKFAEDTGCGGCVFHNLYSEPGWPTAGTINHWKKHNKYYGQMKAAEDRYSKIYARTVRTNVAGSYKHVADFVRQNPRPHTNTAPYKPKKARKKWQKKICAPASVRQSYKDVDMESASCAEDDSVQNDVLNTAFFEDVTEDEPPLSTNYQISPSVDQHHSTAKDELQAGRKSNLDIITLSNDRKFCGYTRPDVVDLLVKYLRYVEQTGKSQSTFFRKIAKTGNCPVKIETQWIVGDEAWEPQLLAARARFSSQTDPLVRDARLSTSLTSVRVSKDNHQTSLFVDQKTGCSKDLFSDTRSCLLSPSSRDMFFLRETCVQIPDKVLDFRMIGKLLGKSSDYWEGPNRSFLQNWYYRHHPVYSLSRGFSETSIEIPKELQVPYEFVHNVFLEFAMEGSGIWTLKDVLTFQTERLYLYGHSAFPDLLLPWPFREKPSVKGLRQCLHEAEAFFRVGNKDELFQRIECSSANETAFSQFAVYANLADRPYVLSGPNGAPPFAHFLAVVLHGSYYGKGGFLRSKEHRIERARILSRNKQMNRPIDHEMSAKLYNIGKKNIILNSGYFYCREKSALLMEASIIFMRAFMVDSNVNQKNGYSDDIVRLIPTSTLIKIAIFGIMDFHREFERRK